MLRVRLLSAVFVMLVALAPWAHAQNFPSGPVRIIVPFPAGGATDVLGRVLSLHLQALWGPPVVSEYRPGAAGLIGTRQVAAAPADGYTLLMASTGAILALAGERPGSGAFDITRELAPISLIAAPPYIVVVHPSLPVTTATELIAYGKQNPGKLAFGSSGVGSASHLSGALFQQMTGIDMLHVPYRGTGPAVTDLLGGRINVMFSPAVVVTPHIAAGTLRVIGTTGRERSALFPDFPTLAMTGFDYQSLGWFGLFAPPERRVRSWPRSAPTPRPCSACPTPGSGSPSRAPSPSRARPRPSRPLSMRTSPSGSISRTRPASG